MRSRRAAGADYPLLGTDGMRGGADIARMVLAGAHAVEILSVVMPEDSWRLHACSRSSTSSWRSAVGAYGGQPEAPGRWERLSRWKRQATPAPTAVARRGSSPMTIVADQTPVLTLRAAVVAGTWGSRLSRPLPLARRAGITARVKPEASVK
jgi:hypothetical protein